MWLLQPAPLLSLFFTILTSSQTNALPSPQEEEFKQLLESRYHYLSERTCANPCGWTGQLCCTGGQTCGTNSAGEAVCNSGGGSGTTAAANDQSGWEYYTTTYVETDLVTRVSTYSSFFGSAPTATAASGIAGISCNNGMGESPCGSICCATGQYCAYAGQCQASNGNGDESSSSYLGQIITTAPATNTAPLRPTSNAVTTVSSTGSATTTVPIMSAAATSAGAALSSTTSNNGLSGGAIAGIVIGVIAGIIFLILLLICCCFASAADAVLACLGLRPRRRRETTTYIEEHRHHSGSGGAAGGRRWFGMRPARVERPPRKSSNVGGLTAVAGGLTALAVILGLKRRRDRKQKTEYSGSSYSYGYYSSDSKQFPSLFHSIYSRLLTDQ